MTVKELIAELKAYPADSQVLSDLDGLIICLGDEDEEATIDL